MKFNKPVRNPNFDMAYFIKKLFQLHENPEKVIISLLKENFSLIEKFIEFLPNYFNITIYDNFTYLCGAYINQKMVLDENMYSLLKNNLCCGSYNIWDALINKIDTNKLTIKILENDNTILYKKLKLPYTMKYLIQAAEYNAKNICKFIANRL